LRILRLVGVHAWHLLGTQSFQVGLLVSQGKDAPLSFGSLAHSCVRIEDLLLERLGFQVDGLDQFALTRDRQLCELYLF